MREVYSRIGVEQDCILSPLLLIILKDDIVNVCKRETKPLDMGNWLMKPVKISEVAFADDLILPAKSEEDLQHHRNVWNREMASRNKRTSFRTSDIT
jgi:hypothetical protein